VKRDRELETPLRVHINTEKGHRPGHGYFQYDVRQDDRVVEFYQDGEHIYTACSGEVFGHEYFMQILGDVINAAMLLKEGREDEAALIGKRFVTSHQINADQLRDEREPPLDLEGFDLPY
jgi:hypothetical protein